MMSYAEAAALADAGAKVTCSTASGRTRYLTWGRVDGIPVASIYGNPVVTFYPGDIARIDTCGWVTPSTFDAIGAALGYAGNRSMIIGTRKRVPTIFGIGFTRYATVDLANQEVISHDEPTQAAPPRPAKVW